MSAEPAEFSPTWFDAASAAWLQNKRKLGNGSYRYTCDYKLSTTRRCGKDVYKTESMCRQHWAKAIADAKAIALSKAGPKPESPKSQ